jgi:hypothetical protein
MWIIDDGWDKKFFKTNSQYVEASGMKRIDNIHHVDCVAPIGDTQKYQCEIGGEDGELLKKVEADEIEIDKPYGSMNAPMSQFGIRNVYAGEGRCFVRDGEQMFCHRIDGS